MYEVFGLQGAGDKIFGVGGGEGGGAGGVGGGEEGCESCRGSEDGEEEVEGVVATGVVEGDGFVVVGFGCAGREAEVGASGEGEGVVVGGHEGCRVGAVGGDMEVQVWDRGRSCGRGLWAAVVDGGEGLGGVFG